jgi:hypothetical protein
VRGRERAGEEKVAAAEGKRVAAGEAWDKAVVRAEEEECRRGRIRVRRILVYSPDKAPAPAPAPRSLMIPMTGETPPPLEPRLQESLFPRSGEGTTGYPLAALHGGVVPGMDAVAQFSLQLRHQEASPQHVGQPGLGVVQLPARLFEDPTEFQDRLKIFGDGAARTASLPMQDPDSRGPIQGLPGWAREQVLKLCLAAVVRHAGGDCDAGKLTLTGGALPGATFMVWCEVPLPSVRPEMPPHMTSSAGGEVCDQCTPHTPLARSPVWYDEVKGVGGAVVPTPPCDHGKTPPLCRGVFANTPGRRDEDLKVVPLETHRAHVCRWVAACGHGCPVAFAEHLRRNLGYEIWAHTLICGPLFSAWVGQLLRHSMEGGGVGEEASLRGGQPQVEAYCKRLLEAVSRRLEVWSRAGLGVPGPAPRVPPLRPEVIDRRDRQRAAAKEANSRVSEEVLQNLSALASGSLPAGAAVARRRAIGRADVKEAEHVMRENGCAALDHAQLTKPSGNAIAALTLGGRAGSKGKGKGTGKGTGTGKGRGAGRSYRPARSSAGSFRSNRRRRCAVPRGPVGCSGRESRSASRSGCRRTPPEDLVGPDGTTGCPTRG